MRLLAGLRQYYRQVHEAGRLSPSAYKVLSYVTDQSAHTPEKKLDLWSLVSHELGSGPLMQAEATAVFKLKCWTAKAKMSENALVVRRFSREEGMPAYQALELQLYRTTAVYVLDLLRDQVGTGRPAGGRTDGHADRRAERRAGREAAGQIDRQIEQRQQAQAAAAAAAAASGALSPNPFYPPLSPPLSPPLPPGLLVSPGCPVPPASAPSSVVLSVWVEAMYKAIAAATGAIMDLIRSAIKDACLVVLQPGQGIVQRTTMVLMQILLTHPQGSLAPAPLAEADGTGGAGGDGGPLVASSNELPSVMVWVSDCFEGELVAQRPLQVVAGPRGATLLVWGLDPEGLLVEQSFAMEGRDGPAAAAAGSWTSAAAEPAGGKEATAPPPPPPPAAAAREAAASFKKEAAAAFGKEAAAAAFGVVGKRPSGQLLAARSVPSSEAGGGGGAKGGGAGGAGGGAAQDGGVRHADVRVTMSVGSVAGSAPGSGSDRSGGGGGGGGLGAEGPGPVLEAVLERASSVSLLQSPGRGQDR